MFTGIVEEVGKVIAIRSGGHSAALTIAANKVLEDTKVGDSIAVNGVCLTVTGLGISEFTADVMHETMNRSSLNRVKSGSSVNLERAMAAGGRFGGHIVSGHVDGLGIIQNIEQDENAIWYTIKTEAAILRYIVEKGSVTIDGISLTVAKVGESSFSVSTIPHTNAVTTLRERKTGDVVNLENDIIGKYVERLLRTENTVENPSRITREFLTQYGF